MKKIIPIYVIVLMVTMSCHYTKNRVVEGTNDVEVDSIETNDFNWSDSFTVVYRQPVNGYKVKAIIKPENSDVLIMIADMKFEKNGKSFTLHTSCFGDSMFCKGRIDYEFENPKIFKNYINKTIDADYHLHVENDHMMPMYTPFFFMDLDFDGVEELVIVHHSMAVRFHDEYDVYRIVEGKPFLIDYPPFNSGQPNYSRMTDYPEFDFRIKTISCPYPEGPGGLGYKGQIIYGISKKQKDTVVVNGRKHFFNHLEPIKEIKYE